MTKITKKKVKHIANLARLELSPSEIKKFQQQLSDILKYMENLNELKTEETSPTSQVTGLTNITRKDKLSPTWQYSRDAILKNAPEKLEGYFKVKTILNQE